MADPRVQDIQGGEVVHGEGHLLLQQLLGELVVFLTCDAAPAGDKQPLNSLQ